MKKGYPTRKRALFSVLGSSAVLCAALILLTAVSPAFGDSGDYVKLRANHPGVGAWFGKAMEDCTGEDPTKDCAGLGLPAVSLFMTPSFYADGNFLGNDSLALGQPPFGPHTTAHGEWVPTGRNTLVADIVFLLNPFPPPLNPSTGAVHIKYSATVITPTVMVGYVNIYFAPALELEWHQLSPGEFPTLPDAANYLAFPPDRVFTQQSQCTNILSGCPLVFRFKVQRVAP